MVASEGGVLHGIDCRGFPTDLSMVASDADEAAIERGRGFPTDLSMVA